jgi:hypothetical protein
MNMNYNWQSRQPFSYINAIMECKLQTIPYKFVRYENGGMMLAICSPTHGWFPFRGSLCTGQPQPKGTNQ